MKQERVKKGTVVIISKTLLRPGKRHLLTPWGTGPSEVEAVVESSWRWDEEDDKGYRYMLRIDTKTIGPIKREDFKIKK